MHKVGETSTASYHKCLKAFFPKILNRSRSSNNKILHKLDSHFFKHINLHIHNTVRKSEFRDAVFEYAPYFMKSFKNSHIVTLLGHITGKSQSGRAGADGSYFYSILYRDIRY